MTGNKRPWKIQSNDYGEENYSYISEWAMLASCSSVCSRTGSPTLGGSRSKSLLSFSGLWGSVAPTLSSKSSVQHFQASLTEAELKESSSVTSLPRHSAILKAGGCICHIKTSSWRYALTLQSQEPLHAEQTKKKHLQTVQLSSV